MSAPSITAREIRFRPRGGDGATEGLDALLTTVTGYLRRYVVLSDDQIVAVALWVAHTHAFEAADCTPYLQITSATKRAGKTRLLEVLEPIVARPWFTGRTSAAALMRKIDAQRSTLLLDESDAAFNSDGEYGEALRGQLNLGYRRRGSSTVCVGQGTKIEARDFSTFSPKAIAGIGQLPPTVADRAIRIELRRKTTDEPCARWRDRDGTAEARPISESLARWAGYAVEVLSAARPGLPRALSDRAADVWEPLLAIADLAGSEWAERARRAAIALSGTPDDGDINVELLHDIARIFEEERSTFLDSTTLASKLAAQVDRPWADWRQGRGITPKAIAERLKGFSIVPVRNAEGSARGYRRDQFDDALARYPPAACVNPSDAQ
ncbi:MAG: DUF3631 domain-containing protein [Acidobacteriota bacterium]